MNEIYKTSNQNNTVTRNPLSKLFQPPRTKIKTKTKTTKTMTHKLLSYLGPLIWNGMQ